MLAVILLTIGYLLTSIDIVHVTSYAYPAYDHAGKLGDVIQKYMIDNVLGHNLRIDYASNLVGYLLMLIGSILLIQYSKKWIKASFYIVLMAFLYTGLRVFPFYVNGYYRCVGALIIFAISLLVTLRMEMVVVYTLAETTDVLPNQANCTRMKFGWILAAFCRVFVYCLTFVGLMKLVLAYQVALSVGALICTICMFRTYHYIPGRYHIEEEVPMDETSI